MLKNGIKLEDGLLSRSSAERKSYLNTETFIVIENQGQQNIRVMRRNEQGIIEFEHLATENRPFFNSMQRG